MTLNELFKNTTYDDTLFSAEAKSAIESRIFMKSVRSSEVPYITWVYPVSSAQQSITKASKKKLICDRSFVQLWRSIVIKIS